MDHADLYESVTAGIANAPQACLACDAWLRGETRFYDLATPMLCLQHAHQARLVRQALDAFVDPNPERGVIFAVRGWIPTEMSGWIELRPQGRPC